MVSICLILNNDYWGTVYSLERSGFNIIEGKSKIIIKDAPKEYIKVIDNTEVELLVAYTDASDKKLIEYFQPIATHLIEVKNKDGVTGAVSDAHAYNQLFLKTNGAYICILKPYVFFQQHWLTDLIYTYQNVSKSGIIGICNSLEGVELSPLPSPDIENFVNVFLPIQKTITPNGVLFFLREYLHLIGALDESCNFVGGDEITQYQLRCVAIGLTNYYIPTQSCLITKERPKNKYVGHEQSESKIKTSIAEMRKNKTFYLPLSQD